MPNREYWIVEVRRNTGGVIESEFRFYETRAEAEKFADAVRKKGFTAHAWNLGG